MYIPTFPSRHGINSESMDRTISDLAMRSEPYNLRLRTNAALPLSITTKYEPSVKEVLSSPESQHWIDAINEEFNTIEEFGTYED